MYFVDRNRINDTLTHFSQLLQKVNGLSLNDSLHQLALERITHMVIESMLDVGNAMIDGFIMRDPGSYEDIIDILTDEKVIPQEEGEALKEVIGYRKMLVQEYLAIAHKDIFECLQKHLHVLQTFPERVRTYLDNELGPVSAFKN